MARPGTRGRHTTEVPAQQERVSESLADNGTGHEHRPYLGTGDSVPLEEMERAWADRTRIILSPVAPPSVLGLFGFMGATVMVAAWMAGWYGGGHAVHAVAVRAHVRWSRPAARGDVELPGT